MRKKSIYVRPGLLLICCLLTICYCDNSNNSIQGEWEWINNSNDRYPSVNVFHQGVVINMDSLLFISDYMLNPFFNEKKYSATADSISVWYSNGKKTFEYSLQNDRLTLISNELNYVFERIHQTSGNSVDSLSFSSENPGRSSEEYYFFELDINKTGEFVYRSKYQGWKIEGKLQERYRKFIFDKINKIEIPVRYSKEEEIPQGDHVFILEFFEKGVRVDSITYSREIEGAYAKWLASILQSTPLWIDEAILKKE